MYVANLDDVTVCVEPKMDDLGILSFYGPIWVQGL